MTRLAARVARMFEEGAKLDGVAAPSNGDALWAQVLTWAVAGEPLELGELSEWCAALGAEAPGDLAALETPLAEVNATLQAWRRAAPPEGFELFPEGTDPQVGKRLVRHPGEPAIVEAQAKVYRGLIAAGVAPALARLVLNAVGAYVNALPLVFGPGDRGDLAADERGLRLLLASKLKEGVIDLKGRLLLPDPEHPRAYSAEGGGGVLVDWSELSSAERRWQEA